MRTQLFSPFLKTDKGALFIFILIGYLAALFLYFIDEGNFHLNNLVYFQEWIALSVYAVIFVICFRIAYVFLKKSNVPHLGKLLFSIVLGLGMIPILVITMSIFVRIFS